MRIHGFTHVSLSVADLDRSLAFYRDLLHLPVLAEPFEGTAFAGREAMLVVGRGALCLQEHRENGGERFDPARTGLDHLAFAVDGVASLHGLATRLTDAGVPHSGVKPIAGYGQFVEVRDPDGIQVELHVLDA